MTLNVLSEAMLCERGFSEHLFKRVLKKLGNITIMITVSVLLNICKSLRMGFNMTLNFIFNAHKITVCCGIIHVKCTNISKTSVCNVVCNNLITPFAITPNFRGGGCKLTR